MSTDNTKKHESYGMIEVSRFTSNNAQFFGSDIRHNGGVSIRIHHAEETRKIGYTNYYPNEPIVDIQMSDTQFAALITSAMNTTGIPCTIQYTEKDGTIPQIDHVTDVRKLFNGEMKTVQRDLINKVSKIEALLSQEKIGAKAVKEALHQLDVLKSFMGSNEEYVMKCFNEQADKTVTDAKHSIASYIDMRLAAIGAEALANQMGLTEGNKYDAMGSIEA